MLDSKFGFYALINTAASDSTGIYNVIHWHVLGSKTLASGLKKIMFLAIRAVNL
jgi:hypothetical protein